ncbi:16215_t:CDS:2, partial [Racocetra persica]
WDLRPNKNYYSYIDGAVLVYDISQPDSKTKINELLLDEDNSYINNKIPIMIIANKCDKYENKNREDLLKEKQYFGEKFLFNTTSFEEKTSTSLDKILEEINDLNELAPPNNQFKSIMEHATQLYLCEIPKVIYGRQQQVELSFDG